MNRSALPFLAASMADADRAAVSSYIGKLYIRRRQPPKGWPRLPTARRARSACAVRRRARRVRKRTLGLRPGRVRPGSREFRPESAGTRLALCGAHDQRPAICLARAVEESDHHARRHARAGARHRRDDDDVRVVECGGAAAAAVSGSRIASSSCGATSNARSSSAAARRFPTTSIGKRRASRST